MKPEVTYTAGLLEKQAAWLEHYRPGLRVAEQGMVVSVGDGIAWIAGLPSAAMEDVLAFEDGSRAVVFDLTEELLGAVLLHATERLTAGTVPWNTQPLLSPRPRRCPACSIWRHSLAARLPSSGCSRGGTRWWPSTMVCFD